MLTEFEQAIAARLASPHLQLGRPGLKTLSSQLDEEVVNGSVQLAAGRLPGAYDSADGGRHETVTEASSPARSASSAIAAQDEHPVRRTVNASAGSARCYASMTASWRGRPVDEVDVVLLCGAPGRACRTRCFAFDECGDLPDSARTRSAPSPRVITRELDRYPAFLATTNLDGPVRAGVGREGGARSDQGTRGLGTGDWREMARSTTSCRPAGPRTANPAHWPVGAGRPDASTALLTVPPATQVALFAARIEYGRRGATRRRGYAPGADP